MELIEKFVNFHEYCPKCKHKGCKGTEEPCNECLTNPANYHSHKPVNFEEEK